MHGRKSTKLKCKYCSFSTTDRGAMAQHLRTYHSSVVPASSSISSYNDYSFIDSLIIVETINNSSYDSGSSHSSPHDCGSSWGSSDFGSSDSGCGCD